MYDTIIDKISGSESIYSTDFYTLHRRIRYVTPNNSL